MHLVFKEKKRPKKSTRTNGRKSTSIDQQYENYCFLMCVLKIMVPGSGVPGYISKSIISFFFHPDKFIIQTVHITVYISRYKYQFLLAKRYLSQLVRDILVDITL